MRPYIGTYMTVHTYTYIDGYALVLRAADTGHSSTGRAPAARWETPS
jgi:hypothetical protein